MKRDHTLADRWKTRAALAAHRLPFRLVGHRSTRPSTADPGQPGMGAIIDLGEPHGSAASLELICQNVVHGRLVPLNLNGGSSFGERRGETVAPGGQKVAGDDAITGIVVERYA